MSGAGSGSGWVAPPGRAPPPAPPQPLPARPAAAGRALRGAGPGRWLQAAGGGRAGKGRAAPRRGGREPRRCGPRCPRPGSFQPARSVFAAATEVPAGAAAAGPGPGPGGAPAAAAPGAARPRGASFGNGEKGLKNLRMGSNPRALTSALSFPRVTPRLNHRFSGCKPETGDVAK